MKKLFFTIASMFIIAVAANAQTANVATTDKTAEKEAKALAKAKQTKDIDDAIKQAGFTQDEATKYKEITQLYNAKSTEIKKNTTTSEEEKATKLKANSDEKNAKLKEAIAVEKYKEFNKIRKAQKEKETSAN